MTDFFLLAINLGPWFFVSTLLLSFSVGLVYGVKLQNVNNGLKLR